MTVDPNNTEQPELSLEPAAAPEVDVDALADAMVEKLTAKAEERTPAPAPPPPAASEVATYKEMVARANDPAHPLHHDAVMHLAQLRRQGEEDEWDQLGCPPGHPARTLFRANPMAYSGRPIFAFQRWQLEDLQARTAAAEAAKPKEEPVDDSSKREKPKPVGMPSRSVGSGNKQSGGKLKLSVADFLAKPEAERDEIEKKADRGEVEWIT